MKKNQRNIVIAISLVLLFLFGYLFFKPKSNTNVVVKPEATATTTAKPEATKDPKATTQPNASAKPEAKDEKEVTSTTTTGTNSSTKPSATASTKPSSSNNSNTTTTTKPATTPKPTVAPATPKTTPTTTAKPNTNNNNNTGNNTNQPKKNCNWQPIYESVKVKDIWYEPVYREIEEPVYSNKTVCETRAKYENHFFVTMTSADGGTLSFDYDVLGGSFVPGANGYNVADEYKNTSLDGMSSGYTKDVQVGSEEVCWEERYQSGSTKKRVQVDSITHPAEYEDRLVGYYCPETGERKPA